MRRRAEAQLEELASTVGGQAHPDIDTDGGPPHRWRLSVPNGSFREVAATLLEDGYELAPTTPPFWKLIGTARLTGSLEIAVIAVPDGISSQLAGRLKRVLRSTSRSRGGRIVVQQAWRWTVGRHHRKMVRGLLIDTGGVFAPFGMTALLVDLALEATEGTGEPILVDVGTATGAAAVLFAHARSDATVIATDVSRRAVRVAAANAKRLGVEVDVRRGSLLRPCLDAQVQPDVVISNIPFVPPDHLRPMSSWALTGSLVGTDPDGLGLVRDLIDQALSIGKTGLDVMVEVMADQVDTITAYATSRGAELVRIAPDHPVGDRVVWIRT